MSANRLKLNEDKTELLWTGTKHSLSLLGDCGQGLRLGADTVIASEHVRLLGVTISSDLSLDTHVSNVCAAGFFRLRQLRRVWCSLDSVSAATLHAFVSSRGVSKYYIGPIGDLSLLTATAAAARVHSLH